MAGSRLEFIGTVFSRMSGLLRTGAIRYEDRPVWFDVYRVFPPKLEPHYDREPVLPPGVPDEIPDLMYNEDIPRAAFYKKYGKNPGGVARNLKAEKIDDPSVRFVEKFNDVQAKHPDWNSSQVVESVMNEFTFRSFSSETQGVESEGLDKDISEPESSSRKRGTKRTVVTAETLLSMFKEAKLKSQQTKDDSGSSNS